MVAILNPKDPRISTPCTEAYTQRREAAPAYRKKNW